MDEVKEKLEKERKFLLKKIPTLITPNHILHITQCYKDGYRYRLTRSQNAEPVYEKIKKKKLSNGINSETEITEIDFPTFYMAKNTANKEISKRRFVYEFENKVFEMDVFDDLNLIILEVEGVELDEVIRFPPEINSVIIMEVTGNEKFDNFNLAD